MICFEDGGNKTLTSLYVFVFAFIHLCLLILKCYKLRNTVNFQKKIMMESKAEINSKPHQFIGSMALVVKDYDEAIEFFTKKLDFDLICDEVQSPITKRWVLVRPPSKDTNKASEHCCLLLARAVGEIQGKAIGNQTGGRVFMFLHTDDFWRDYNKYKERGIKFVREPAKQDYGIVAVFEDISGNLWDLVEMNK